MPKNKNTSPALHNIRFAALAVDVVCFRVLDQKLQILLGTVNSENNIYNGQLAHIGGLVRVEETVEESVGRLLRDKAGIKHIYFEQLYTFSEIKRDPRGRVVSVAHIALMSEDNAQNISKTNTETVWKDINHLPSLAYDHDTITTTALNRLRSRIVYTDIARYFLPAEFTLSDLQKVYETVLGREVDKRNFRKKILGAGILKDTGLTRKEGVMRPAALYGFVSKRVKEIEIL